MVHFNGVTASFVDKFWGDIFTYFHIAITKCESRRYLVWWYDFFGRFPLMSEKIISLCFSLFVSPVSPFLALVKLNFSLGRIVAFSHGCNHKTSSHHLW